MLIDNTGGKPVLAATMVLAPVAWQTDTLPDDGWDRAIRDGLALTEDQVATAHIGLAATVSLDYRRQGLSALLLKQAAKQAAGLRLIIPVRPSQKSQSPKASMADYLAQTREDGLSVDPWIRVHQRLGAKVLGVVPRAMTMTGTDAEWEQWCGPRQANGVYRGLLAPLTADGTYVEPNVWIEHNTAR